MSSYCFRGLSRVGCENYPMCSFQGDCVSFLLLIRSDKSHFLSDIGLKKTPDQYVNHKNENYSV